MTKLKPYEKYKETNVDWIGSIPSHWEIRKNSLLFREITDTNHTELELLSIMLDRGIVKQSSTGRKKRMSENNKLYKRICVGDIGYNLMNAFMGSIGASRYEGIISPAYAVCRPKIKLNPWYYHYLFRTPMYKAEFNKNSYGIMYERNRLYFDRFKRIFAFVPPVSEQDQIVRYLDYQLTKINKFIKAKKKLISLLKEQKQAVINEAVTKGLNPNVKLKPSGIEWLGDIPEHWEIKPLRQLLRIVSIKNRPDLPLLSVVREKGIILRSSMSKKENHNFIPDDLSGYKVVESGQFVMNKMKAWQGSYGVSAYSGIVSPAYYIFELNFRNKDYFHYAIRSKVYVNFFYQASDGVRVGQWDLDLDKMKEISFFIPPEKEQKEIIEFIPKEFQRIEDSINRLQKEIALINEYRTRLISDVVTGKVDVRTVEIDDFEVEELEADIDVDAMDLEEVLEGEECED